MWICQKCNAQNTANFCMNCGAAANAQTADDLPPTIVGFQPPIVPNQPSSFQPNQPPQFSPPSFPPQPPPGFQPQPNLQTSPQSSGGKKLALIGGIIGLIVVMAGGFVLWRMVVGPYVQEQARLRKEEENQRFANSTTAISLLPDESNPFLSDNFRKGTTLDKMQLLQASQNLPPELKSELSSINDAAAAEYIRKTNPTYKVLVQILKYNSRDQANATCDKVGRELEKKKDSFTTVKFDSSGISEWYPCKITAEDKKENVTEILSLYGFLIIASAHKNNTPSGFIRDVRVKLER